MKRYVAVFHTHLSALRTARALKAAHVPAQLAPVPRFLSASCGTCVRFEAEEDMRACMDRDFEALVLLKDNDSYEVLLKNT